MTNDKCTYTIEFADEVSRGLVAAIHDIVEPDVLTVETDKDYKISEDDEDATVETDDDGNTLTVAVWGSGHAIPVFEEQMTDYLDDLYPSAEITETNVAVGQGVENSPE